MKIDIAKPRYSTNYSWDGSMSIKYTSNISTDSEMRDL